MPTLRAGSKTTQAFAPHERIKITSNSIGSGKVYYIGNGSADIPAALLRPNTSITLGPFANAVFIRIECDTGDLTYRAIGGAESGSPVSLLVPNARQYFCVIGDSQIFSSISQDTALQVGFANNGPQAVIQGFTHQNWRTRKDLNLGVNGDTSTGVSARFDAALATDASVIILLAGTNDLNTANTSTMGTYQANILSMIERAYNAGKILIIMVPLNRDLVSVNAGFVLQQMQRWTRSLAWRGFPNLYIVDANKVWTDPTSATSAPKTYYSVDGLHQRGLGAFLVWIEVAKVLNFLTAPRWNSELNSVRDVYEADYNPSGNLLPNGILAGSEAIGGSGGPTFGGVKATDTTILANAGTGGTITGLTVTGSKGTLDNGSISQRLVLSGNGTGSSAQPGSGIILRQSVVSPGTKIIAGDTLESGFRLNILADMAMVAGVRLRQRTTEGGVAYDQVDFWDQIADLLPPMALNYSLRTQPREMVGTVSAVEYSIWLALRNQSAVDFAGTWDMGDLYTCKVLQ